ASLPKTAAKAAGLVLGLAPEPALERKAAVPMSDTEMQAYVGRFANHKEDVEIVLRDGKLFMKQRDKETALAKSAAGRLFTEGRDPNDESDDIVPVPAQGAP